MAITKAGLSSAMQSALTASAPLDTPAKFCDALADAIVTYLKANAQVTVVTTCPAGAGTGVGAAGSALT